MKSVNPATGQTIQEFAELGDAEIDARVARAAETFLAWRRTAFAERARLMARAAERLEAHLAPEEVKSSAKRSTVYYQPLGPVLAVMPWNFPFWQVFRFAAPALMAG